MYVFILYLKCTIGHDNGIRQLYQLNDKVSMHGMNIILFTFVLWAHSANIFILWLGSGRIGAESMGSPWDNIPTPTSNALVSAFILVLRATVDIISIAVLRCKCYFILFVSIVYHKMTLNII